MTGIPFGMRGGVRTAKPATGTPTATVLEAMQRMQQRINENKHTPTRLRVSSPCYSFCIVPGVALNG